MDKTIPTNIFCIPVWFITCWYPISSHPPSIQVKAFSNRYPFQQATPTRPALVQSCASGYFVVFPYSGPQHGQARHYLVPWRVLRDGILVVPSPNEQFHQSRSICQCRVDGECREQTWTRQVGEKGEGCPPRRFSAGTTNKCEQTRADTGLPGRAKIN
jgi:hypothetical protein